MYTPNGVVSTSCILWATGIRPCAAELVKYPILRPTLQTEKFETVFFAGDSALLTYPESSDRIPALAQMAEEQGKLAAKNILQHIKNQPLQEFTKRPSGILVSLGHNIAGGQIGPFVFTGKFASVFCKLVYASKMPSLRKKIGLLRKWFIH